MTGCCVYREGMLNGSFDRCWSADATEGDTPQLSDLYHDAVPTASSRAANDLLQIQLRFVAAVRDVALPISLSHIDSVLQFLGRWTRSPDHCHEEDRS